MRNFNNLRTIDLKEYLPGVLKDVAEIRAVMDTETPEIQALWNAAEACMNDQFIQTATEDGIARRESMLGISPYASDTLADRRFRLQSLYTENVPYTRRSLKNWLETLCGKDGYVLTITTSNFNVDVKVALGVKKQENVIRETLERMLPYNMTFSVSLLYNIWGSAKTKTWGSVKTKTWQNLKEEVSV